MKYQPDKNGYFGQYGGAFVPELLYPNVKELEDNYIQIIESEEFQKEYKSLLKDYVGRPTPFVFSKKIVRKIWCPYLFKTRRFKPHRCT